MSFAQVFKAKMLFLITSTIAKGEKSAGPAPGEGARREIAASVGSVSKRFKGTVVLEDINFDVAVYLSGRKRLSRTLKALLRRRSATEPVVGHLKQNRITKMERNYLRGKKATASMRY